MTETRVSCRFEKACSSYLPNRTLEAAMYQAVCHYGTPPRARKSAHFAAEIRATLSANDINNSLKNIADTGGEDGKAFARRHRETRLKNIADTGGEDGKASETMKWRRGRQRTTSLRALPTSAT